MRDRIAIAMSGGVDSLMAAALLTEAGHEVFGLHFFSGFQGCKALPESLVRACALLGMELFGVDLSAEFSAHVTDFFVSSYARGLTPNPCMACNRAVKFGALLERARGMGASRLATGHYARLVEAPGGGRALAKAMAGEKDQSYFLALVPKERLALTEFPLGGLSKERVRAMAAERGLSGLVKTESQEACFLGDGSLREFLELAGLAPCPGPIEDEAGKILGTHQGVHAYTVGQRRGIGVPAATPLYVLELDPARNRLIVGPEERLYARTARVREINWLVARPTDPLRVAARIRYRHREADATLVPASDGSAALCFDHPQKAVTPGQGAVFYQGDRVLGGGWIENAAP
ncbi:MAG: tRNA 2-thiouridine(34) synthase MnmA [Thermodesulfobacteriota bacterium]